MREAKIYLANFIANIQAYIDPEIIIFGDYFSIEN